MIISWWKPFPCVCDCCSIITTNYYPALIWVMNLQQSQIRLHCYKPWWWWSMSWKTKLTTLNSHIIEQARFLNNCATGNRFNWDQFIDVYHLTFSIKKTYKYIWQLSTHTTQSSTIHSPNITSGCRPIPFRFSRN